MIAILNNPALRNPLTRTGSNILKLGILAGTSIFVNNLFKAQASDTIFAAKVDYETISGIVKRR